MMGGKIEVASKPGRGSVFSFTARFGIALDGGEAKPAAVSNGQGEERTPAETGGRNEPLRVLVVEDNPVNQKVAIGMLKRHGHTVTLVTNGLEALGAYGESRFDIVLMDVQMPVMDGLSATQAIREIEAQRGGAHLPIIGLTAHALPSDQTRCLEAGMDGFLSKPFKLDELLSLMQELTSQYAARNLSRHVTSDLP